MQDYVVYHKAEVMGYEVIDVNNLAIYTKNQRKMLLVAGFGLLLAKVVHVLINFGLCSLFLPYVYLTNLHLKTKSLAKQVNF